MSATVREQAVAAKAASRILATLAATRRNDVLEAVATALAAAREGLFAANALDLQVAQAMTESGELTLAALDRLTLDTRKLDEMAAQVRSVAALPDPLGRTLDAVELDDADPAGSLRPAAAAGLHLEKIGVPLGVLGVIFEARPDAVTQIAALALKSGNAVILKAGKEVEHTAAALVGLLRDTLLAAGLPEGAVALLGGREQVDELLAAHGLVDLILPRGSRGLIDYVQANTRIPVLGHAEGVCHIYVDRAADQDLALRVIEDAKTDYPAACNAVETVLVHRDLAAAFLPKLAERLRARGVALHGNDSLGGLLPEGMATNDADFHTEYGGPGLSLAVVDSLDAAIDHIHTFGSAHTESILTDDAAAADRFLREVDAAGVFHNASTRFADGFRYGFGAEVGVSTGKFHARGPVGLEGLTTYKYILRGQGHVAGDYRGTADAPAARAFTHRREGR